MLIYYKNNIPKSNFFGGIQTLNFDQCFQNSFLDYNIFSFALEQKSCFNRCFTDHFNFVGDKQPLRKLLIRNSHVK